MECDGHLNHEILDIISAYELCIEQHKEKIAHIRTDIIYNNLSILSDVKRSEEIYQSKLSGLQECMTKKTVRMKSMFDSIVNDLNGFKTYKLLILQSRLQIPKRNITRKERYLYQLEQVLDKPVQFLICLKKTSIPRITFIPDTLSFSLSFEMNRVGAIKLLGEIQITETGKRQIRNEQLLELMHTPVCVLEKSFTVIGAMLVRHISCVTRDLIWISDPYGRIILTNTTGDPLHIVNNTISYTGGHSVTREGNLIFIDKYNNINKLSLDNKTCITLIKNTDPWKADCLFSSPSNGDLIVAIIRYDTVKNMYSDAKVIRYNSKGQQMQVIKHDNTGQKLYKFPKYITENHNKDVIVSDLNHGVVVTEFGGKHRFSYMGPPSGPRLSPLGVCVDALSNILVSDAKSQNVQMIDKDGHFLSLLLTKQKINVSGGLDYDNRDHLLFVGTTDHNRRVDVYRYIKRKDYLIDDFND
ncbi:uncharacterized protein LOC134231222 [Saccostrea cucullata]|uniref:uncharacterized protein LOC134231222 n=1 Tax=Saccostrea cuccullata TaxID=36930 RepID=UPI002ED37918